MDSSERDRHPAQILWRRLLPVLAGIVALAGVTTLENTTLAGSLADRPQLTAQKRQADQERFLKLLRQHNNVGTDGDVQWRAVVNLDDLFWSFKRSLARWARKTQGGRVAGAARMLGVDRTTLQRWLRRSLASDTLPGVEVMRRSVVLYIHLSAEETSAESAYRQVRSHLVDLALRATGGSGVAAATLLNRSPSFVQKWGARDGQGISRSPTSDISDWLTRGDVQKQLGVSRHVVFRWHPVLRQIGAALDQAGHIVYPPQAVEIVVKLRDKKVTPQEAAHAAIYAARHDMDVVDFAEHRRKKREQAARRTVLKALRTADYHHKTAATLLGVHRRTLERRAKRLGITPPRSRGSSKQRALP